MSQSSSIAACSQPISEDELEVVPLAEGISVGRVP